MDGLPLQPVVIDNGTGVLKAGFAGADKPKVVFHTHVGRPKHKRVMVGGNLEAGDVFVGRRVDEHRGAFRITHPMRHGVVESWPDMERVWAYAYGRDGLNVASEEHPLLLTEAPLNPYRHRHKCAEILFESFGVPALSFAPQAVLSLYASGRTTGVVLDSGAGVTHCVPVYEGFAVVHAVRRSDIAGRDVTERLQLLLRRAGHTLHTSAEMEVVRDIKEKHCFVAFNPAQQEEGPQPDAVRYELPDGSAIPLGPERFRAPEILFRPDLIGEEYPGVHDCLMQSIMAADMDLRRVLFDQIVLSGGSTLFEGFGPRLLNELRKQAPRHTKIRVSAPPERRFSTWVGGSILASLAAFKTMWVSKAEYEEQGSAALDRKAL